MCGRFTLRTAVDELAKEFGLAILPELSPRYNIAPTQLGGAVRLDASGQRHWAELRWGLIPVWAEDPGIGNRLINARGETVASKPAFRQAFQCRRCLVVADGFYEWQKVRGGKQPQYIRRKGERPFGFAGLWERWQRDEQTIESCTIITTAANELMQPIHDRMPVILASEDYDLWLDLGVHSGANLEALLRPYPAKDLEAFPVSMVVNNPRNNVAECIQRLEA